MKYACLVCGRVSDERRCAEHALRGRPRGRPWQRIREQILMRDGWQCTFIDEDGDRCDETTRLHVDHVMPIAAGGSDEPWNLAVLCERHNLAKGGAR